MNWERMSLQCMGCCNVRMGATSRVSFERITRFHECGWSFPLRILGVLSLTKEVSASTLSEVCGDAMVVPSLFPRQNTNEAILAARART